LKKPEGDAHHHISSNFINNSTIRSFWPVSEEEEKPKVAAAPAPKKPMNRTWSVDLEYLTIALWPPLIP
jgi:hypothetical protein